MKQNGFLSYGNSSRTLLGVLLSGILFLVFPTVPTTVSAGDVKSDMKSDAGESNAAKIDATRCEAGKRYAVETIDGVPMMTIDGEPVRSRIFWGRVGSSPVRLTPEFQKIEFTFRPAADSEGIGTVHFRFGQDPGTIFLDDFEIVEKETGRQLAGPYRFEKESDLTEWWKTWHDVFQGRTIAKLGVVAGCGANGSSALRIDLLPTERMLPTDFHLYHRWNLDLKKGSEYLVRFVIRADSPRNATVAFYLPRNPHVSLGGYGEVLESQVRMAAERDVHFVSFMLLQPFWRQKDGAFDFSMVDHYCDRILAANPQALIIPRLEMDAPVWWLDENPDERMRWEHVAPKDRAANWQWASPASRKYRREACEALRAVVRHLEEKYGNSIAGYHPAGQNTQEWFTANTWLTGHADYSPAARNAFRLWLREKYPSDAALQDAWGTPDVTLASAEVPAPELRDQSLNFPMIDPAINPEAPKAFQAIVDFNEFFQKQMTDAILELARVVKEETKGRKLCFVFYGYCYEFSSVFKGPAASAHYDLRSILNSPDIDVICSPMSYFDRQLGGGGSCMVNAESVTAAGKIYLYEDDTRTFLARGSRAPGWDSGAETLEETRRLLLRNTAESAMRNFGTWWMDLGGAGWFESPELWKIMDELKPLDEYFLQNATPYDPEIGVFIDEGSMLRIGSGRFTTRSVSHLRWALNRSGAPYAQYLTDDLLAGRARPPKLCLIANAPALSAEERAAIERKIQEAGTGAKIVWIDFDGLTPEKIREYGQSVGVHFFTDRLCCVWANGPFILLHAPEEGVYRVSSPTKSAVLNDFLSGERDVKEVKMEKGETRIFRMESFSTEKFLEP